MQEYDTFDIAKTLFFWLQHNWEGMGDPLYKDYCILTSPGMFKPSILLTFEDLSPESMELYEHLTRDNYNKYLDIVLNYECTDL